MAQRNGLQQFARGFLPATDPLTHLPKAFAAWENLANDLPKLLMSNSIAAKHRKKCRHFPQKNCAQCANMSAPWSFYLLLDMLMCG